MSDFLLVVPEGYIEIENAQLWLNKNDPSQILGFIIDKNWEQLSHLLEASNYIPEAHVVQDARLIDAGSGYRFWFKM